MDLQFSDLIVIQGSNFAENHPVGFRFVTQGEGARREGRARRSALHAHERARRPVHPDPLRHRHRVHRRPDQLRAAARRVLQRVRSTLHQRVVSSSTSIRRHRRPRRALLAASTPRRAPTTRRPGSTSSTQTGSRSATQASRIRAARSTCCASTSRATRRRWSSASAARRKDRSCELAELFVKNSGRERTAVYCYAMGWAQHTVGVQNIRAAATLARAARQHRAARRRHHGAARPRLDPRLDRHRDALRFAARATSRRPASNAARRRSRPWQQNNQTPQTGWWANWPKYAVSHD